jgi:hypothetical protein
METTKLMQSPLAVLTLIAAPAILTNATTVLAQSTINRMLHTRERMHELFARSEVDGLSDDERGHILEHVNRVEQQAEILLRAMRAIYAALAAFASATLVTLLGEGLVLFWEISWFHTMAATGLWLFLAGVSGLVFGSANLLKATHLSLGSMRAEAALIRNRQAGFPRSNPAFANF